MKKFIIASALVTGMFLAGAGTALAGEMRDCVAAKAADQLTEGQAALVSAHGDGEINLMSTAMDNDLNIGDVIRVRGFLWSARTSCAMGN